MTNREVFLKKLAEMDNEDLAYVLCASHPNCDDCDAVNVCVSAVRVAEWLGKEEKDDLTD